MKRLRTGERKDKNERKLYNPPNQESSGSQPQERDLIRRTEIRKPQNSTTVLDNRKPQNSTKILKRHQETIKISTIILKTLGSQKIQPQSEVIRKPQNSTTSLDNRKPQYSTTILRTIGNHKIQPQS